jgi:hypothetical protein
MTSQSLKQQSQRNEICLCGKRRYFIMLEELVIVIWESLNEKNVVCSFYNDYFSSGSSGYL